MAVGLNLSNYDKFKYNLKEKALDFGMGRNLNSDSPFGIKYDYNKPLLTNNPNSSPSPFGIKYDYNKPLLTNNPNPSPNVNKPANQPVGKPANSNSDVNDEGPSGGGSESISNLFQNANGMLTNLGFGASLGAGAITGLIGGLLENREIESHNRAIQDSINTMNRRLDELKREREDAISYRRGEASNFLTNYITARDPNKSTQIAQMYQIGQDRFRSETNAYDQMKNQVTGSIAELESKKQKKKSGLEILGQTAMGTVQLLPFALMG